MRLLVSLVAAACAIAPAARAAPSCSARIAALKARLAAVPPAFTPKVDPGPGAEAARLEPPTLAGGTHAFDRAGPTLAIAADRVELDGVRLPSGSDRATARLVAARWAKLPKASRTPIYVLAGADVARRRIDAVVARLPRSALRIIVGVSQPAPAVPHDAPAWLVEQLHEAHGDPSQTAVVLAKALQRAIGPCAAAEDVLRTLASIAPEDKGATLVAELPAAVAKCGCSVTDVETVGEVLEILLSPANQGEGWITPDEARARHLFPTPR